MSLPVIEEWFSGPRDYIKGVDLYDIHGMDSYLKFFFRKWPTAFSRRKLEAELHKIEEQPKKKFTANISQQEYLSLPEQVQQMNEEKGILYKEMSHLHSRLRDMPLEERKISAFRILAIDKQLRKLWNDLDYYAEHGSLPDAPGVKVESLTPAQAQKRITTVRTYLSRNPESPKAEEWKVQIEKCELIINESRSGNK